MLTGRTDLDALTYARRLLNIERQPAQITDADQVASVMVKVLALVRWATSWRTRCSPMTATVA